MTAALVWFRRDLRLADNGALREALAQADAVVPVYIHDPEADGDWPPGAASRWWLHESLAQLSGALERAGSRLVVRRGSVRSVLAGLLRETGAKQVFWNHLYEPERFAADESLCKWLGSQHGVRATACAGALLAEPWTLRTGQGRPYRVFTPYWRAFLRGPEPAPPRPAPDRLPGPDRWPKGCGIDELGLLDAVAWHAGLSDHWQPGEAGAARRLARFLAGGLEHYADTRDLPALEGGVSRLSAHLHFGEISPGQVWHAVRGRGDSTGTEAYLRELGWRDFACHVLFHHPATPTEPLYSKYRDFPWRPNHQRLLDAWQRGLTGYPLVDAGMRELWTTGWMHNRVRMVAASLLVKNIRAPWQAGARWFWDTLVDADLASNTMGWQWSAGCGADAAPYFRVFNPVRQSERFDPAGVYIRRWVPELSALPDRYLHAPWQAPADALARAAVAPGRNYPLPVVDYKASRAEALAALKSLASPD